MNILFITHYHELNGSIRSLLDLAMGLNAYNVTPYFLISREGSFSQFLNHKKLPFKILPIPWWMSEKRYTLSKKAQLAKGIHTTAKTIKDIARLWQIDLVYTNTSVIPVGLIAAKLAHLPHIWHIREFGDLDFSLHFLFGKAPSLALIKSSSATICHSKVVCNYYFKPKTKKVHQIYNGCATQGQFAHRLQKRLAEPAHQVFTFLMLSNLSPKKGQEHAIRALAALHERGINARLILAGSGRADYIEAINKFTSDLNISDYVQFKGFVEDPFPLYIAADCALICSDHEAFSRVGIEAMSTALPVIGKNNGGNPELILHEETGLLYSTFDELVNGMARLAAAPQWAQKLGLAGWELAKDKFNIEDYAANVYKVIESITQ